MFYKGNFQWSQTWRGSGNCRDGFKNILTEQKVCSLLVRRIKGDKTQRIMNNSSCFIFCAASRSAEPAGEFEPSPGPAALGEGQRESRIHPGWAPDPGAVAARYPGGQHRRTQWVSSFIRLSPVMKVWSRSECEKLLNVLHQTSNYDKSVKKFITTWWPDYLWLSWSLAFHHK